MSAGDSSERGPETMGEAGEDLEFIRERFDEEVERISETLKLDREDVMRLGVVLLGHHLDMTNDPDTLVLVVKGTISPYDTAMEAMLSGGAGEGLYTRVLESMEAEAIDAK